MATAHDPLAVAFVAFDGMTTLDLVGAHDPIVRLDDVGARRLEWDVCALSETVTGARGMTVTADRVEPDLGTYDLVVVPGGPATRELRTTETVLDWLRTAESSDLVASVCTGSLLLGAAGYLAGRRATTHPDARELLAGYCEVRADRIVDEGPVITAGGVSAGIDLGLHVVERFAGVEARLEVAERMDYPYAFR